MRNIHLRLKSGETVGQSFKLAPPRAILGRDNACEVILSSTSVSRRHALLSCDDGHTWTLSDLGSTNGTTLEREPLTQTPVPLPESGTFWVGDLALDFWFEKVPSVNLRETESLFSMEATQAFPRASSQPRRAPEALALAVRTSGSQAEPPPEADTTLEPAPASTPAPPLAHASTPAPPPAPSHEALQQQLLQLSQTHGQLNQLNAELREANQQFSVANQQLEAQNQQLELQQQQLMARVQQLDVYTRAVVEQNQSLRQLYSDLLRQKEELGVALEQAKRSNLLLYQEPQALKQRIAELSEELERTRAAIPPLENEVVRLGALLAPLEKDVAFLTQDRQTLRTILEVTQLQPHLPERESRLLALLYRNNAELRTRNETLEKERRAWLDRAPAAASSDPQA